MPGQVLNVLKPPNPGFTPQTRQTEEQQNSGDKADRRHRSRRGLPPPLLAANVLQPRV